MKLTEEEIIKFTQCLKEGLTFTNGTWIMEFYNNDKKYQSQEIQNTKIKIFRSTEKKIIKTNNSGKQQFSEDIFVECFDKDGFLKWAEKDGKDIPIPRADTTVEEWEKIKLKGETT